MDNHEQSEPSKQRVIENKSKFFQIFGKSCGLIIIICILLWNADGFWQTEISPLKNIQKKYFPAKYVSEQLKLSRVTDNNEIIANIQKRQDNKIQDYELQLAQMKYEEKRAKEKEFITQQKLDAYLGAENKKCRYYETSLMIIKNLRRHYSEDDIQKIITCTNHECEDIMSFKPEALTICNIKD
ncbi:hypothetical protein [Celerinatantimonas sp. YJH-8]|uniref:hypothetical protein n=1 Tax=Celerinatantimonas sp. YJH-8 TaxID=3228714 RepID=UPI0038C74975